VVLSVIWSFMQGLNQRFHRIRVLFDYFDFQFLYLSFTRVEI